MKKIIHSILIFLGFWLSPLSPWNDLFTNIPLAYLFALPFSAIDQALFLPMAVVGYWISNILGFLLMHFGYVQLKGKQYSFKNHWKKYILVTTLYTILIAAFIYFGILPSVDEIKQFFHR